MKAAARLLPCSPVDLGGRGRLGLQRVLAGAGGDPWRRRSQGSGSGATPAGSEAARPGRTRRRGRWPGRVRQIQRLPRRTSARTTASGRRFMSSSQAVGRRLCSELAPRWGLVQGLGGPDVRVGHQLTSALRNWTCWIAANWTC
jgi:hypothetical protein